MPRVIYCTLSIMLSAVSTMALSDVDYSHSNRLSPDSYLYGSNGNRHDPVFDKFPVVDLSVDLGIGSDCGRIDVKNTMRTAFKNILDSRYIEDMGRDILAASPMLLLCYYSPTWCAIVKQAQLRASMLTNLRLDQCSTIDKYTDSRVGEYQVQRQQCVHKKIANDDGNFETAMESCGNNLWQSEIANWSGDDSGGTRENRLIDSSAKWSHFNGEEGERTVSLVKSLVGDTVIKDGAVSVDFGKDQKPITPRSYLMDLEAQTHESLCGGLLKRVDESGGITADVDHVISDRDLKELSGESDTLLVDRQTIRSLAYMPENERKMACRKLSDAIAMSKFTSDMSKALDFLASRVETNPHLPDYRRQEVESKRKMLKDQIEMTLTLSQSKNEPLNDVLYRINRDGAYRVDQEVNRRMRQDEIAHNSKTREALFMDCADGVFCNTQ